MDTSVRMFLTMVSLGAFVSVMASMAFVGLGIIDELRTQRKKAMWRLNKSTLLLLVVTTVVSACTVGAWILMPPDTSWDNKSPQEIALNGLFILGGPVMVPTLITLSILSLRDENRTWVVAWILGMFPTLLIVYSLLEEALM